MKNPFFFRYKNGYKEFFIYLSVFDFTIIRIGLNSFYHVYQIDVFGIRIFKHLNYRKYKKEIDEGMK